MQCVTDPKGRVTINITPELKEKITQRAKGLGRSVSAHVSRLIMRDLGFRVEEEQAPYIARKLDEPTGPPNPSQRPGAGPAAEIPA
jgi:hypothetical protein